MRGQQLETEASAKSATAPPRPSSVIAYRQSLKTAARQLKRPINMARLAVCMGAYQSPSNQRATVRFGCSVGHGRTRGGLPSNNGNRGRWYAPAN